MVCSNDGLHLQVGAWSVLLLQKWISRSSTRNGSKSFHHLFDRVGFVELVGDYDSCIGWGDSLEKSEPMFLDQGEQSHVGRLLIRFLDLLLICKFLAKVESYQVETLYSSSWASISNND